MSVEKRHLVFVGTSHTNAIRHAHDDRQAAGVAPSIVEVVHLRAERFDPARHDATPDAPLGGAVTAFVASRVGAGAQIVSCLNGNHHNVIGLMQHHEPFDFSLPGKEGLPLAQDARILPHATLRAGMETSIANELAGLRHLAALAPSLIHVESPPPIRSEAHIRAYADPYFRRRRIDALGVSPPALRYKLWCLYSSIVEDACRSAGVSFLKTPADVLDDEGFLHPDGYPQDATHGNAWYGERILRAVEDALEAVA